MNLQFFRDIKRIVKNNYKIVVGIIALFLMSIYIISIYFNAVKYSINTLDDFLHYCTYKKLYLDRNFSVFDFAVKYTKWHLVSHGGLYFSMFIQILLGPNPYTDIVVKNEAVMVSNMLIYFVSLFALIFVIITKLVIRKKSMLKKIFLSLLIFLCILILHNSYQFYTEIFTWFSGAASYSIPISFLFISIVLFVIFVESHRKCKYFLILPIIITSICGLGGSVTVVCIAFIMVLSLFIYTIVNKKINIVCICLFFNYLCFALLNVGAPGNFHRLSKTLNVTISYTHELFDPGRITLVLNATNKILMERYVCLFSKYNFIFILITVAAIIGFWIPKIIDFINYRNTFFTILPFVFMPYLVSLSFAVGYQDKVTMFDRCFFLIDFSIIFTLFLYLIFIFSLLHNMFSFNNKKILCVLVIAIIFVLKIFITGSCKLKSIENSDMNRIELITVAVDNSMHKYKEYNKQYADRINTLRAFEGRNLAQIRYLPYEKAPKYIMKFYDGKHMPWILPDEEYLACFYDINKIIILENTEQ